jgi:tetratricopeptide (TPR) repeat protein
VSAALERILSSAPFARSSQLANFLRFVVNEQLSGRDEAPKEYALGRQVFGRGADYDPRIDPIVRVQARQLRFKLSEYYETTGVADPVRIEMPKGSYLPEISFAAGETLEPELAAPLAAEPPPDPHPVARVPAAKSARSVETRWIFIAALFLVTGALGFVLVRFVRPGGKPTDRAANSAAQDLYLSGKYYWNKRTPESLNRAVDFFTQAIVRDPRYAKAYSGLADCYNLLREYSAMPASEAWPRAIAAAKKAVELDSSSAEAHSSLAFALFYGALDTRNGEREFRRAIELNPEYEKAHHWYATALMVQGRYPESLAEIERARQLDPSSTAILADKGFILFYQGHPDQAVALLRQVEAAEPASQSAHTYLAAIYLTQRDSGNYLLELQKAAELSNNEPAQAIWTAAREGFAGGGAHGMFERILEVQQNLLKDGRWPHYDVAKTFLAMGKRQEALDQLQAAVQNREMDIVALGNDPSFAGLHSEPRFQELEKQLKRSLRT